MDELTGVLAVTELADAVTGLADAVTELADAVTGLADAVTVLAEGVLTDGFTENMVAGSLLYIPGDERDADPELIFVVLRVDICI